MDDQPRLPDTIETIPEALAFWAERTPEAPAIIVPGRPAISYAALWDTASRLARSLNEAGIGRQDRIVLHLSEGPALAMSLLGTMTAAIALPLSASLTTSELAASLDGFNAAGAILAPPIPDATRQLLAQSGVSICELHGDAVRGSLDLACDNRRGSQPGGWARSEDIAVVSQTSGTTGKPKRVARTHGSTLKAGRAHRDRFGLGHRDRTLAVAPMTLALGSTAMLHGIAAGAALILPPPGDLTDLWAVIETESPTWMHASAGFLTLLARFLRGKPDLPPPASIRFARVTAAPISATVCEELERRLGAPVLPSYSSSEVGAVATALPPPARSKPGSTGQPIQEMKIADEEANEVGPGEEGEIWVRATRGFAGYLDDPEMNAAVLVAGGWFRTGDVGYLDEDGFLFLTGRVNEIINRGGSKISPIEVDEVLLAHPAVREAATFAVADEHLGEDIVAAVVVEEAEAPTRRELRAWMGDRLVQHKVPRRIWFVNDLPRTSSGKPRRGELAARFSQDHGIGLAG